MLRKAGDGKDMFNKGLTRKRLRALRAVARKRTAEDARGQKKSRGRRLSGVEQGGVKQSGSNHPVRIQITGCRIVNGDKA